MSPGARPPCEVGPSGGSLSSFSPSRWSMISRPAQLAWMDMPSTGRIFHTASQVFGTSSSCISATAFVPFSSNTIFLPIGLFHPLDEQVFLPARDHVFARTGERIQARTDVREQVDGLRPARALWPGVSVVDDADLRRL